MNFQEMLWNAVCYLPLAILLFTTVLISPALAFFPQLIRTPKLATAIPIVSLLIVNFIAIFLFKFHLYQHSIVLSITLILFFISIMRVRSQTLQWEKNDLYLLFINIGILLPLIAFCGLSSFRSNDALASWNLWAIDFYNGVLPQTMMGYPPFFSFFISYCYKVLGNFEYQGPVKVLLVAFPLTMMNAIAFMSAKTKNVIWFYILLVFISVFPGFLKLSFYGFHAIGYADPLLAAAVVTSFMLLLKYLQNPTQKTDLFFAVLCGIVASLSKQPGLLWCFLAMPVLIITKWILHKKIDKTELLLILLLFIPAGMWLLGAGSRFYDNQGVITESLKQDHITFYALFTSFKAAFIKYFLLQPTLFLIFILAVIASRQNIYLLMTLLFFIIPGLILWFMLGSYDIRLGLYLLVSCALIIAANDYLLDKTWVQWIMQKFQFFSKLPAQKIAYSILIVGFFVFILKSFTRQINFHHWASEHVYPLDAARNNLYYYFDDQAEFIYQNIYNKKDIKIYTAERCIRGIFHGHTPIVPHPYTRDINVRTVMQKLKTYQPDYVFAGFCQREYADCKVTQQILKEYPGLLTSIPIKNARYDHRLYRLNKQLLPA